MMKSTAFIATLKIVADNYKTVYANGMFGQPITAEIIDQKRKQLPKWYTADRVTALKKLIGKDYFGFDCVCLFKAILWGWNGSLKDVNGGAKYQSNGVPDISTSGMIEACSGVSKDFTNIVPGELVYMPGHVGVYIGDGKVIECTPAWKNSVQYTYLGNIAKYRTSNYRVWEKHGKLPWVEYVAEKKPETAVNSQSTGKKYTQCSITLTQLEKGCKGADVKAMQQLLAANGYVCGSTGADGDFGDKTEKALKGYQGSVGLGQDGKCGNKTWHMLLKGEKV